MTSLKGKKILLVDDEPSIREMLKDEFLQLGATIEEASGGHVALEMVKSANYDAVISDAKMPEGDGIELAVAIRKMGRTHPKVFLCSGMLPSDFEKSAAACFVAIFEKPLNFEKIIDVVTTSILNFT